MQVVGSTKAIQMIGQFFDIEMEGRTMTVKEGDTLTVGSHTLRFAMAPMVHWPEVMVTYDEKEKILFPPCSLEPLGAERNHFQR